MMIQINRKPRKGDRIGFGEFRCGDYPNVNPPTKATHTVWATPEGNSNLCWLVQDGQRDPLPFIWWFEREKAFNQLAHFEVKEP